MEKTEDKRINLIMEEEVLDKTIHVDVTLFVSLGATNQKAFVTTGAVKSGRRCTTKRLKSMMSTTLRPCGGSATPPRYSRF